MTPDPPDADRLSTVLPAEDDLPGAGWLAIDDGFGRDPDGPSGAGELIDCVGPDFPAGEEVVTTGGTPHWVRPPGRLLHAMGVVTSGADAADRAERILAGADFAACLGRSVATDLADDPDSEAELLAVDTEPTARGHRVRFTGGTSAGVRPVQLDVVCVRHDAAVGLLWFADTPGPFPADDVDAVLAAIARRRAD